MKTISALIEWNTFRNHEIRHTRVTVQVPNDIPITKDILLSYCHRALIQKQTLDKGDDYMHEGLAEHHYID